MTESSRAMLRQMLIGGYGELKTRLTSWLGSSELASDALHDTWLRLETATLNEAIRHPKSYLLRIAYNIALNQKARSRHTISLEDAEKALDLPDSGPDPLMIVEGGEDIELLKEAASELTERQRSILFAARLEGVPVVELATRYGVSRRWIQIELRRAVFHCAARLERETVKGFAMEAHQVSKEKETDEQESGGDDLGRDWTASPSISSS